ncbi:MAG: hypothetical protein U9Q82_04185 [Chloroflexota bacterium]|nr:hypothetical protein [Chloroflexota bacterium]
MQQTSLERILPNRLQQDPLEAFMDIMNVIEIALCLNLVSSEEIFSLYLEFHSLRNNLKDAGPELERIHLQLRELIEL